MVKFNKKFDGKCLIKSLRGLDYMKAAVLHGQGDIRFQEVESPEIGEGDVLINVKITGICGSDIPRVLGDAAHFYPIVLGHEFSGEVIEVGKNINNLSIGDRIAAAPLIPCHQCIDCQQGNFAQCKNYSFIGSRESGSWAEYVKIPAINAVKLPDSVSYIQGAFLEPTSVGIHGLSIMNFQGGTDVAVIGMGTIGLLAMQCAKALGARRIFVFDIDDQKLEVAREYGADKCLNTGDSKFKSIIEEETKGRGFETVIETAGVEFTEKLSLEVAANKGNVMFIGTPSKDISLAPHEFEYINRKELTVRGSWMSYSAPYPGREWELAVYYFQKGIIKIDKLIDRIIPLEKISDAFRDIADNKVKGKVLMEV